MRTERIPGGSWSDITQDGRVVTLKTLGDGRWGLWEGLTAETLVTICPGRLMYARATEDATGTIVATAQGHADGRWWVYDGTAWASWGQVGGANCVEIVRRGAEVVVYGQVTDRTYATGLLSGGARVTSPMTPTSQGFLDASTPGLLWTDAAMRVGDAMKPHGAGGGLVGQYHADPPRLVYASERGVPLHVLWDGPCEAPRAWRGPDGTLVAVAMGVWETIVVTGQLHEFRPWVAPTPPPGVPPQPPPSEEEPVGVPNYLSEVQRLAQEYQRAFADCHKPELGDARAYAFIKRVASVLHFDLGDRRVGLNLRRGTGPVSWDALAYQTDTGVEVIDCVSGAGGPDPRPAWQIVAGPAGWVQPERVVDTPTPPGPTPPPVTPPTPQPPAVACRFEAAAAVDLAPVLQAIAEAREASEAQVAGLRDRMEAINAELHAVVNEQVQGLLAAIQARR